MRFLALSHIFERRECETSNEAIMCVARFAHCVYSHNTGTYVTTALIVSLLNNEHTTLVDENPDEKSDQNINFK